jgi:pyruvate/2-oxoglutarate dehydrogenase complex dihydrolipoamide acyltransferase (E2) component
MLKLKVGEIVQNKLKQFTKIVALKSGFVYFNGWHLKKEQAEKTEGTNGNSPMNERGFARAVGQTLEADTANAGAGTEVKATDAIKAFAAENGIDLATVTGTGAGGNILKKDVEAAIKAKADLVDFTVTEETVDELNAHLPDGAEPYKVGDVAKLSPDHELLK